MYDETVSAAAPSVERQPFRRAGSWAISLAIAFGIAFGVRATVAESFVIPSASMEPTLQINDHILVEKSLIDLNGYSTGDLIVFDRPPSLPSATTDALVKRIVAVGGSSVSARNGVVSVDGQPLNEPYVSGPTGDFGPVRVPLGQLFVMGDNRSNSTDSRVFGPIREASVVGSAFARTWPVNRIGPVG